MANSCAEINAMLPEGAPKIRVGDPVGLAQVRLIAHLIGQVAELAGAVERIDRRLSRG